MSTIEEKKEQHNSRKPIHLFNLIKRRSGDTPNFALLIGAGASISSKVKPTSEMMNEWASQLYLQTKSPEPFDAWQSKQEWYNSDEKYSILFERVYDQPAQRRNYIEECVKDAKPSWGYIYLANIIANNYFNVIFTPNFDDLLNEACFTYACCKPIVCAHDSTVTSIRVTSDRPKIIKLHGDFLYDNIKNTVRETENLEKNMRDKLGQFAKEYGLIVVGYGGNDRSIMDILTLLVRSEGNFPHGIYWCIRKGSKPGRKLELFLRRENVYFVEIEGFDEFYAEMHHSLGLTLPDTIRDPFKATTENLNRFMKNSNEVKHEVIRQDLLFMQMSIKKYESVFENNLPTQDTPLPYEFLANSEYNLGNFKGAAAYLEKALIKDPGSLEMLELLSKYYSFDNEFKKALDISDKIKALYPQSYLGYRDACYAYTRMKDKRAIDEVQKALKLKISESESLDLKYLMANAFMILGETDNALNVLNGIIEEYPEEALAKINKAIALKRQNKHKEAKALVAEALPSIATPYIIACAYAIANDREKMLKSLKQAIKTQKGWTIAWAPIDPDFEDYRNDKDFNDLLKNASTG